MSNIFANRLRNERESLGLKQKEMAEKLNIPANTYNGYETGKRIPSLDVANSIAKTLELSLDYLLGNTNTKVSDSTDIDDELIDLLKLLQNSEKDKIETVKNYLEVSSTKHKNK